MEQPIAIAVVGTGYVGLVAAVCFAEMGHAVTCVDSDEEKVRSLKDGIAPIHEQYLPELLGRHGSNSVRFTTSLHEATHAAEAVFIAVGTPQSDSGDADLSYVEAVACEIARSLAGYCVIVEKSTVPVYTNEWIRRIMERNGVAREAFDVASNPEFLREGTAISDFLHPDRVLVGADSDRAAALLEKIYRPLIGGDYYRRTGSIPGRCSPQNPPPLVKTSAKSAEIIKHASNAFLATKISFINAVANLCEAVDANVEDVARGMGMDSRIGEKFLRPGIGYGGSCFPKDVAAFRSVSEQAGVDFSLLAEVEKINATQKRRFVAKVRSALWTLRGKRLGVLGLAFKGGTDDIRESPAMEIVQILLQEGCNISAYDPAGMERAQRELPPSAQLRYATDAYDAAEGADALLILTDWAEFAQLDLLKLHSCLRYPIVIDGRNLYSPAAMFQHGLMYLSIGRPASYPTRDVAVTARL
jgi:UDPglucose 6-dehydrogenase